MSERQFLTNAEKRRYEHLHKEKTNKYYFKALKPLKWHDDQPGFDGVVRHSTGADDVSVCGTRIYIRYDVTTNTCIKSGMDDGTFSVSAFIPGNNYIKETVGSFESGKKKCEELREEFWNKLYKEIERMFA